MAKRIEYVYDEACKFLDKEMDLNICNFKNNK